MSRSPCAGASRPSHRPARRPRAFRAWGTQARPVRTLVPAPPRCLARRDARSARPALAAAQHGHANGLVGARARGREYCCAAHERNDWRGRSPLILCLWWAAPLTETRSTEVAESVEDRCPARQLPLRCCKLQARALHHARRRLSHARHPSHMCVALQQIYIRLSLYVSSWVGAKAAFLKPTACQPPVPRARWQRARAE